MATPAAIAPVRRDRAGGMPRVPGYRLLRRLGSGRRSTVWLAEDRERGDEVALKLVPRRGGGQPFSFADEFALARALANPRLVAVRAHGCDESQAWLAMEHAAGGDLAQRMGQAMDAAQALALIAQLAQALAPLHRAGWVHRDLKPANCLLAADGRLLLADLGLAGRSGQPQPQAGALRVHGTPRYLAPEQLQGAPLAPAADVYSLGVLLHETLGGAPPPAGATLMEILAQRLVAPPPRLPAAQARWQPLVDALLARDPAARLPDADAVLRQLAAADVVPREQ